MQPENIPTLLDALLDSWCRNNTIFLNLLDALPDAALEARALPDSPTVAQLFHHIGYVRLVFVQEDAPNFAQPVPDNEWQSDIDRFNLARLLNESSAAMGAAVKGRIEHGRDFDLHYDHPILFLQHMIWHEGYHHGQIKLALKIAGIPLPDKIAGPLTWRVWMNKTGVQRPPRPGSLTIEMP